MRFRTLFITVLFSVALFCFMHQEHAWGDLLENSEVAEGVKAGSGEDEEIIENLELLEDLELIEKGDFDILSNDKDMDNVKEGDDNEKYY